MPGSHKRSALDRFLEKVEMLPVESGCWIWSGSLYYNGYGQFAWDTGVQESPNGRRVGGRKMCAHRASWLLFRGAIPDGLEVCHKVCAMPSCVNPDHLALGTHEQNQADMAVVGRGRKAATGMPYGVQMTPNGRYHSRIKCRGRHMSLGVYDTAEEAHLIAVARREELQGPYARREVR